KTDAERQSITRKGNLARILVTLVDLVFQNLRFRKIVQLAEIFGVAIQCVSRDEPDDLSALNLNAEGVRLTSNRGIGVAHSSDLIVHEVHRDLDQTASLQLKAERL